MSTTSQSQSEHPLTRLVIGLGDWISVLRRAGLWRRGEGPDDPDQPVRASDELEQFRDLAKEIIVWLEIHGRDADASQIDDAMAGLRELARRYDAGEVEPLFDDWIDEPISPLELLIEGASQAAGRLEDLDGEIPENVWQGFDDA